MIVGFLGACWLVSGIVITAARGTAGLVVHLLGLLFFFRLASWPDWNIVQLHIALSSILATAIAAEAVSFYCRRKGVACGRVIVTRGAVSFVSGLFAGAGWGLIALAALVGLPLIRGVQDRQVRTRGALSFLPGIIKISGITGLDLWLFINFGLPFSIQ